MISRTIKQKSYKITQLFLLFIVILIFVTGCFNRKELKSFADADDRQAEKIRKEGKGGIDDYYLHVYQERADKQKSEADKMIADDPYLNFILNSISYLFFDDDIDE